MSKKVRFSCPRCLTVLQTDEDRIGCQIACPHCAFRFQLNPPNSPNSPNAPNPPSSSDVLEPTSAAATTGSSPTSEPPRVEESTIPPKSYSVTEPPRQIAQSPAMLGQSNLEYVDPVADGRSASFVNIGGANHGPPPCPNCNSRAPALIKSEVSTTGWIVFAILLFTTVFLCWIGVLIRDKYRVCSYCKIRLGPQ